MKTKSQTARITILILLGIAILVSGLALNRPSQPVQDTTTAAPSAQTGTPSAEAGTPEDVGSTDWIMIMAVVIVLVVIVPILLKWRAWAIGKRK